jgi:hypothetical protein
MLAEAYWLLDVGVSLPVFFFSFSFVPTNERTDDRKRFPSSMPNLCPKIIQALSLSADAHSHPLVRMHSGTAARGTGQYRRHTSSRSRSII